MKNKKGFTLIELLAVIVILAIIALIATPIVLNIIEKARKSAYQDSAYGLIEAAKLKYVEGMLDGSSSAATYSFDGTNNSGLQFSGSAPDSGQLSVDSNGNVALAVIYGNVCYKKDYTESAITQSDDTTNCTLGSTPSVSYKCRRAKTLHTEECTQTSDHCYAAGYTTSGSKGTTRITYGNLGTSGTLTKGDAYDCDVNGDGTYDAATERFYYIGDLYNTTTNSFDNNYAALIYYNNTTLGTPDNTLANVIAYDVSGENWHGPQTAITNLPTTIQWSNVSLSNTSRAILAQNNASENSYGTFPAAFSYSGYAARLITSQEMNNACEITTLGSSADGQLDGCNYLMENTSFSNSLFDSYWLETVFLPSHSSGTIGAWMMNTSGRNIAAKNVNVDNEMGTRPVIEVLKTDIEV